MRPLSVVVITYNEEKNIGRCIDSVKGLADEVIVVDSYSEDDTVQIATAKGAIVKQSVFDGYINQKNKAIKLANHNLVLLLDADEAVDIALACSIQKAKEGSGLAYTMNRCNFFFGRFIRHGLWYPDRKLRLFDKRYGHCGGFNPHDRIVMNEGIAATHLKGDLEHYTFDNMDAYLDRNDAVSHIAAQSLYEAGVRRSWGRGILSPVWTFINGYILRMGFLDGYRGWLIAVHTTHQSYMKYYRLRRLNRRKLEQVAWEVRS